MSVAEYAAEKVRTALIQTKGNSRKAQRLLITACARDPKLLMGLVGPYMQGIVAHAVQRQLGRAAKDFAGKEAAGRAGRARGEANLTPEAMDSIVAQLGQRFGGSKPQPEGMTALINPPSQPRAGKSHQDGIRTMAAAFLRKRLDDRDRG